MKLEEEERVMQASDDDRLAYDIRDVARRLGLGKSAAYTAAARGQIPTIKIGRKLLVSKAALDRLLRGEAV
jgi:excisionase family DNA binding protein